MKKFVKFLLFISVICFSNCTNYNCETENVSKNRNVVYYVHYGDFKASMPVTHFEYNGHKYIMFGNSDTRAIVHDPDCECHNTSIQQIIYEN